MKTIEFLVLLLIEINHLSCDIVISLDVTITYVIRNCTSKGVSEGNYTFLLNRLSYSFQYYIFKLNKSSNNLSSNKIICIFGSV